MKRIDIIKRAGRNLGRSKGRTILTALAISVGAFTIGLALMAGEGGRLYTNSLVDAAGDKKSVSVYKKVTSSGSDSNLPEYSDSEDTENSQSKAIEKYSMTDNDVKKNTENPARGKSDASLFHVRSFICQKFGKRQEIRA